MNVWIHMNRHDTACSGSGDFQFRQSLTLINLWTTAHDNRCDISLTRTHFERSLCRICATICCVYIFTQTHNFMKTKRIFGARNALKSLQRKPIACVAVAVCVHLADRPEFVKEYIQLFSDFIRKDSLTTCNTHTHTDTCKLGRVQPNECVCVCVLVVRGERDRYFYIYYSIQFRTNIICFDAYKRAMPKCSRYH